MVDERLIVALDFHKLDDVKNLVNELGDEVIFYKVGMELFYSVGVEVVDWRGWRGCVVRGDEAEGDGVVAGNVLYYDGVGFDVRGLAAIYLKALDKKRDLGLEKPNIVEDEK